MKISKTEINKRIKRKRNPKLAEAIILAKKNNLLDLGKKLSRPTRLFTKININEIDKMQGDKFLVTGFVLGNGDVTRKFSVGAMRFSESANDKLKSAGCDVKSILEFINSNKKLEGVTVL